LHSLIDLADELDLEDLAAALRKGVQDRFRSMLLGKGLPEDVIDRFAQGVSTMDATDIQEQLESVSAATEKIRNPKDFFGWIWQTIAGSNSSGAMRSLKGMVRQRALPVYDLISDILVAQMLTNSDDSDREYWVTGSHTGDAAIAWALIIVPWLIIMLLVALAIVRRVLYELATNDLADDGIFDSANKRGFYWWLCWGLVVVVLLVAPALVAAPLVTVWCELYLIVKCPGGGLPQNVFVAR
jgi:hypothetical protein